MGRKATVVFGAIAAASLVAAKNAASDAAAQRILALTLENTSHATKKQVAAVEDYISKTSLAVGVADDDLRPAFARLNRSTNSITKSQQLMNLALDITASTGKPLELVTNSLGKAYDGNSAALGKLGLGIDQSILKSKDFNKIYKTLTKTFKGFAEQEANTTEGKMRRLKVATDELKESFGYMLLPYLEKTADAFSKLIPFLDRNKTTISKVVIVIASLSVAIIAANVALKVFQGLQTIKMFAAMIARWTGYTVAVETAAAATTTAGTEMAAAGAVAQVAWAPFLLTITAISAAFVGIKLATDKLIQNRAALLTKNDKNVGSDLQNLYGITPDRLASLNKPSEIRNMPKHAMGGIVTRPHIGMIGEAGPEAIIPLNKAGMFGGVTIINNIAGSVISEKEIALRVRNDMAQLLRRKGLSTAILGV
jgi:hypothetical protein